MFAKHSPLHGLHNGPHSGEEFGSQLQTLSHPYRTFKLYTVVVVIPITAPSKGCYTWFLKVSILHPLGFNWHPFEGAGIHVS